MYRIINYIMMLSPASSHWTLLIDTQPSCIFLPPQLSLFPTNIYVNPNCLCEDKKRNLSLLLTGSFSLSVFFSLEHLLTGLPLLSCACICMYMDEMNDCLLSTWLKAREWSAFLCGFYSKPLTEFLWPGLSSMMQL